MVGTAHAFRSWRTRVTYSRAPLPTLRLLGQLGTGGDAQARPLLQIAELHPVRRQYGCECVAVVVDRIDGARTRQDGNDRFLAARRGPCAGEPAAILLVDDHREWDAREPRLVGGLGAMMRVAGTAYDRFALASPGAAQVGNRGLGDGRHGSERGNDADAGKLRHSAISSFG